MARNRNNCAVSSNPAKGHANMESATPRDQRQHQKKIFVGGLGQKTTTQMLLNHFRRYGPIADAVVLRWPDGRPRGFGYITFAEVASTILALKDTHKIMGCDVDVKRAVSGTNKLFVGGLPQNTTAAEIRRHFEEFGPVSDAVVMMDPATGRSRGFGFICFSPGQDGADAVHAALEQYNHYIRGKWIEVKSAAPPRKLASGQGETSAMSRDTDSDHAVSAPPGLDASKPLLPDASARLAEFSPPPGLDCPSDLDHVWPHWPPHQVPWTVGAQPQHLSPLACTPLPSLLGTGHPGHGCRGYLSHPDHPGHRNSKVASEGRMYEPMKVPIDSGLISQEIPKNETNGIFDARIELRQSLEHVLRLQCQQVTTAAR